MNKNINNLIDQAYGAFNEILINRFNESIQNAQLAKISNSYEIKEKTLNSLRNNILFL